MHMQMTGMLHALSKPSRTCRGDLSAVAWPRISCDGSLPRISDGANIGQWSRLSHDGSGLRRQLSSIDGTGLTVSRRKRSSGTAIGWLLPEPLSTRVPALSPIAGQLPSGPRDKVRSLENCRPQVAVCCLHITTAAS